MLGRALGSIGLLRYLERPRQGRTYLFIRSLFSIYDAEDLALLDLPWWTFDAIERIDTVLRQRGREMTVFEYGSGASTLWLARRCRMVRSVEHDPSWAERSRALCKACDNVEIRTVPATAADRTTRCRSERAGWTGLSFDCYVEAIRDYPFDFDLIVIDGRCRVECLAAATHKLKDGGMIVFDNSDRRRYRAAIDELPLSRAVFRGLAPALPYPGETTVFHAAPGVARAPGSGSSQR
jgi:hypothetical protein